MTKTRPELVRYERLVTRLAEAKSEEEKAKEAYAKTQKARRKLEQDLSDARDVLHSAFKSPPVQREPVERSVHSVEPLRLPPYVQAVVDAIGEMQAARRTELQAKLGCTDSAIWSRIQKAKSMGLLESPERGTYVLSDKGKLHQNKKLRAVT